MAEINFPTEEEFAKNIAEKALNEYLIDGKTLREWIEIIIEYDSIEAEASKLKETYNKGYKDGQYALAEHIELCKEEQALEPIGNSVNPQEKTGWIPVSERLPEDRKPVLVTAYWHETYQVMQASYYGKGLWWCVPFNNTGDHEQKLEPRAWMPLPEPYSEVEE